MDAPCKGKKFGHKFIGGLCMQCRERQSDLNRRVQGDRFLKSVLWSEKDRNKESIARRTMHSEAHLLAKEVSEWCHEPKEFAMYLGRIVDIGTAEGWTIWSKLKLKRTPIRNRAALFMAMTSKRLRTEPAKSGR